MNSEAFYDSFPLDRQAGFTLVNVFHEAVEYSRNYTQPFDMLNICIRAEGEEAAVAVDPENGERRIERENDITLIPANLSRHYRMTTRCERYGIHFRLELYPGKDVFQGMRHPIVENSPELRREADAIFAGRDPVLMLSRCREFALRFCHRHWPERYRFDRELAEPFEAVLLHVRSRGDARTSVEELAEMTGRSPDRFARQFREAFGISPKHFLQRELFLKAARMLLAPSSSVKSVAFELHFSSEFYFSKFFRRLSGVSPKEYRSRFLFSRDGK